MIAHLVAALLSISASPPPQLTAVQVGARVRARVDGTAGAIAGPVVAVDDRRIRMAFPGAQVGIPWRNVSELSISGGNGVAVGARRGALVGAIIGGVIGLAQQGHVGETDFVVGAVLAPASGALVGAIAGALIAPEAWRPLALDPALRAGADAVEVDLFPGSTIRVNTAGGMHSGMVERRSSDSLIVLAGYPAVSIPWKSVQGVQVRGGPNRLLGALFGFVAGAALALSADAGSPIPDANANALANLSFAIGGGLLGSRYLAPRTWTSLPLPPH